MANNESGFETSVAEDMKRWTTEKLDVGGANWSVRSAKSGGEAVAATERLNLNAAGVRDFNSTAFHQMRHHGHADGIDVPKIGRVCVRRMEGSMTVSGNVL